MSRSRPDPAMAAGLSMLIPGLGQIYCGHVVWGLLWLLLTGGSWLFTAGCTAIVFHILASIQAFRQANRQAR